MKFEFIEKLFFKTKKEFQDWYKSKLAATVKHNNTVNCNCCRQSNGVHKMQMLMLNCTSKNCNQTTLCNVRYKIFHFNDQHKEEDVYHLYRLNNHEDDFEIKSKKKYGIPNKIKEIVNEYLYEKDITMPKKIHIKLNGRKYKKGPNKIDDEDIPTLEQIQNYVKYLKQKVFDNNKISDVKKFVKDNGYHDNIDSKEYFTFGESIGNGTDENHFQVGFTSLDLLSRIPSGVIFHFDCTYKIVKVGYPLIVFGISDISRKFYPVCFMFTSHETSRDFKNFFRSLQKLTNMLNILFNPEYMCIDACRALANAIEKIFPSCNILMCWFHLKYNVNLNLIL